MRIISGSKKGKKLFTPTTDTIRPTADRARESIYNILYSKLDKPLCEYTFLDIFSGTGAFGLEALSRGAKSTTFVDKDLTLTKKNVNLCGFTNVSYINKDARFLPKSPKTYDIIFLDAPYNKNLTTPTLNNLLINGYCNSHTLIIAETNKNEDIELSDNYQIIDTRIYSIAKFIFITLKNID